jgi:hypothetical protein
MSLPKTLLAIALLVVAVNAAEARAADPWSAPATIEGSGDASLVDVVFPGGGNGFAGLTSGGALPDSGSAGGATITPGGTAGPARTLTRGYLAQSFGAYGGDRLLAVGARYVGKPRPYWSIGRTSGTLSARRGFPGVRYAYPMDLAVNARGTAVVALELCTGARSCGRAAPAIAIRRAGAKGFSRPVRLGDGPSTAMAVAVNPRGDVLVAWDRPRRGATGTRHVYAAIRTAGGRRTTNRIGSAVTIPRLSAAIGTDRRALVGWIGQRVGEGDPGSPATIQVADAEPRRRFGAAQRLEVVPQLETGHYVGQAGVKVAIAGDGRKLVAWTGYLDGRFVVRAGRVEGGELREPAQVVSDPATDTVLGDLVAGPAGEAVAMLLSGIRGADPSGPVGVLAAARTPGTDAFATPEVVAAPQGFRENVHAAIAPTTGRVVAAWRDLDAKGVAIASRPTLAPGAYALPG